MEISQLEQKLLNWNHLDKDGCDDDDDRHTRNIIWPQKFLWSYKKKLWPKVWNRQKSTKSTWVLKTCILQINTKCRCCVFYCIKNYTCYVSVHSYYIHMKSKCAKAGLSWIFRDFLKKEKPWESRIHSFSLKIPLLKSRNKWDFQGLLKARKSRRK